MRSGINGLTNARIESSTDNNRRRHKIFSAFEAQPETLMRAALHDTAGIDFVIETEEILSVGECIEIYQAGENNRTAIILWISKPLAGCYFIEPENSAEPVLQSVMAPLSADTWKDQPARTSSKSLSIGARIWIIIGLSLLLWGIISRLVFWVSV